MKTNNLINSIVFVCLILFSGCTQQAGQWTIQSPDEKLSMTISLQQNDEGETNLQYTVADNNETVIIKPSPLV